MEQHDRNGRAVADYLSKHKKVQKVFYPGLADHPQHELAKRQMSGFGSMIAFETGSLENANKMLRKVRVCSLAESLGGVETLISHPSHDDARGPRRRRTPQNRNHGWAGSDLGRYRERGRYSRRSGSGAGGNLEFFSKNFSAHRFPDPLEICGAAIFNGDFDALRKFVGM